TDRPGRSSSRDVLCDTERRRDLLVAEHVHEPHSDHCALVLGEQLDGCAQMSLRFFERRERLDAPEFFGGRAGALKREARKRAELDFPGTSIARQLVASDRPQPRAGLRVGRTTEVASLL